VASFSTGEDGDSRLLQNVGSSIRDYTTSHLKKTVIFMVGALRTSGLTKYKLLEIEESIKFEVIIFFSFGSTAQFRCWPPPWNFPFHFNY
jgi:hypothetical protein